jgi:phosphate acyltransferase
VQTKPAVHQPCIKISIDVMGGDFGARSTLPAVVRALKTFNDLEFCLIGQEPIIQQILSKLLPHNSLLRQRYQIIHTDEYIKMDDPIEVAMRKKRRSSMRLAIEQVQQKNADVCISSGNTGALMAIARYVLKTINGIDRPAIATILPNQKKTGTIVLDLGANADCEAEHLLQFAYMGHALAKALFSKSSPIVGLLNIGEEVIKGSDMVKKAGLLLQQATENNLINFYGNVEGNDIFKGTADVVVCDGFVGNIALKAAEGVAKMLSQSIKDAFAANLISRMMAIFSMPVLKKIKTNFDHRRYNGAMLLGLNGLVIKSHGGADEFAFFHAIQYARQVVQKQLLIQIQQMIEETSVAPKTTLLIKATQTNYHST